jgi:alpha-methylacyl-CoA racemase
MAMFCDLRAQGQWHDERESNLLDGGAPFYRTFVCAGGGHIAIGSLEPQFYAVLCGMVGMDPPAQRDPADWPDLHQRFEAIFQRRTRDEWCALLAGSDACFAPVLTLAEAPSHPHLVARGTFFERDGVVQPAPAPRFSATPSRARPVERETVAIADAAWSGRGPVPAGRPARLAHRPRSG